MSEAPGFVGTRRSLLGVTAGAALAATAQVLTMPATALATGDGDVVLGAPNEATSPTTLTNTSDDGTALEVRAHAGALEARSASAVAVIGVSGVEGAYPAAIDGTTGVYGLSLTGTGVYGASVSGPGVYGANHGAGAAAIIGQGNDGTGVHGFAGDWEQRTAAPAATGVYGSATGAGTGVAGRSDSGTAVGGDATSGIGVHGTATSGTAVQASTADPMAGYALRATGRVRLDRCAGVAVVKAGWRSVSVTPGIDVGSTSAVVATLQGSAGGTTTVHRVSVDATRNRFTIYLTATSTVNVKVAWHLFG